MSGTTQRDDTWLESRLTHLWNTYYSAGPAGYPIQINFGRAARYRYGSIFNQGRKCRILINGLFARPEVPEYVVDATIAHELAHYVHGYASGLPKLHAHPHRGGVIDKEMARRGCFFLEEQASEWRKTNWQAFFKEHAANSVVREAAAESMLRERWEGYLDGVGFRCESAVAQRTRELARRFGFDEVPFSVSWLYASGRRTGLSYRFREDDSVKIHAALAHPDVPDDVIDYEICYWLAVAKVGGKWEKVEKAIADAGIWTSAKRAIKWRRNDWHKFRLEHLPLH